MSKTLNKKVLAEILSEKYDMTKKDSAAIVDVIFSEIIDSLSKGEKVEISGFGKFEVRERPERQGINPATKEPITIKASKAPAFKAAKALKEAVQ